MKTIETLIDDIYGLFDDPETFNPTEEQIENFGNRLATHIKNRVAEQRVPKNGTGLRGSALGVSCDRKSWYENHAEDYEAEPLPASKRLSFLYGDIIEEMLLFLAETSGHSVAGAQDTIEVDGIVGHRDCIIDGVTIDVKSASTFSMRKFRDHDLVKTDPFGYLHQLSFYMEGSKGDPALMDETRGGFLVMDKQHGNLVLDMYSVKELPEIRERISHKKEVVSQDNPPARGFSQEPDGVSGNQKLGLTCSYCAFKETCWPGLRTFLYSNGPRFLTVVAKRPRDTVYEATIDRTV